MVKWITNKKKISGRKFFLICLVLLSLWAGYYWLSFFKLKPTPLLTSYDKQFITGSYPSKQTMLELKAKGFSDIITLLDPLNLPLEPILLKQEIKEAKAAGINLIQIPIFQDYLDPFTKKKIINLINSNNIKKAYVHAYNDTDRVISFMTLVNEINLKKIKNEPPLKRIANKTYDFTKGIAIQVSSSLIVSPQPTDNDLKKYILSTPNQFINRPIKTVIAINTDRNIDQENLLKQHGIKFFFYKLDVIPYDSIKILRIAEFIKKQQPQTLLYSYFGPPESIINTGIILSYLTNRPSLPITAIKNLNLIQGPVEAIAPNIMLGGTPINYNEIKTLEEYGTRGFIYIGPCATQDFITMKNNISSKFILFCFQASDYLKIIKIVDKGGPWYLFGPELTQIKTKLIINTKNLIPSYLKFDTDLNNTR